MIILFIATVKILLDIKWSYGSPPIMLTIEPRILVNIIFEHVVQSLLNTRLLVSVLTSHLTTHQLNIAV